MRRVSIASSSQISAEAGAWVADRGGNAVDAAVASAIVSLCTEPGLVALGSSGFVTVWPGGGEPVVIDAYAEMPGRGLSSGDLGGGGDEVYMGYGGGMRTIVGYGSIATPGALAGLGMASERHGAIPWADTLAPAIRWAEDGFPLPAAAHEYFAYSLEPIFSRSPDGLRALVHEDGRRLATGERVWVEGLAESLRLIAAEGAGVVYSGSLGHRIAADITANQGIVTEEDLSAYQAVERTPIRIQVDDWEVIANPAPAVGGAGVAAMLLLLNEFSGWSGEEVASMVRAQRAVFEYRSNVLDATHDMPAAVADLLDAARVGDHRRLLGSPSTIHVSAVDSDGTACSITMSAGYGSGIMVPGTGLWFNNALGEIELNPEGFHGAAPGTRLVSNMAPTIARRGEEAVLAIGSPGAARITTAIAQTLVNFLHLGMSLTEAVDYPRLHVEVFEGTPTIAFEPGLPVHDIDDMVARPFPDLSMYFGGVQATLWDRRAGLFEAADPRRAGGVARGGN